MKAIPARLTGTLVAGLAGALVVSSLVGANASSHREAPLIATDPVADNTDIYAFVAHDDESTDGIDESDYVTLVGNWIPLEEPASGPNFHSFGDDVLYSFHVDVDGDAVADVTYEWVFSTEDNTTPLTPGDFLYNTGPITLDDDPAAGPYSDTWKLPQTYTLSVVADGERTVLLENAPTPPVNIGPRSTPNYEDLANAAIVVDDPENPGEFLPFIGSTFDTPPNLVSFAGQRDEVFNLDLGAIFDLGGLRPLNSAHAVPLDDTDGIDTTAGYNVHTIALQVPKADLDADEDGIIGVWSTTSRRKTRVFTGNSGASLEHAGPWVQVSRLGMPLVNELVVPYSLKDGFNASEPINDAANYGAAVTEPVLDDLVFALYDALDEDCFDSFGGDPVAIDGARPDIVSVFLTGVPDLNQPDGVVASEMLRLNMDIEPAASFADANTLGVLSGEDLAGFPNGRRPVDDTVDAALRVVAGVLAGCGETAPNNIVTDGVDTGAANDRGIAESFPYLPTPHSGYDSDNEG